MFATKYKPKNLKEFVNQKEAVDKFLAWMKKWKPGKALLLYGQSGTGKTALIEAYAKENNLEFVETNASDFRSAEQIDELMQPTKQISLFKKGKIFLFDEVDGLAGREDLGGVAAIIKIIKESRFPIVLIANSPWDAKFRSLRNYCQLIQFKKISVFDVEKRLREICAQEKIKADGEVLRELAKRSEGDLRAAINDLEAVARKEIKISHLDELGHRERVITIFDVLQTIFKSQNILDAKLAISQTDKDPEEIFWWIENNITKEYEKPEEIAKAYESLSQADLFRQRVISRQNWRMKGYMIDLMAGVSLAKKEVYKKFTRYQYPSRLMVLGRTKAERKAEKETLEKLSKQLHCSTRKIRKEFLPFLRIILKSGIKLESS